ncbi:MAG: MFS transporter [Paracoccaceae bacterium]|jgi:MFS family permease|nr:MFS transporter [Paracoccaceae bacterium]
MLKVIAGSWALLLGMGLLMVGNGLQGTLMGVRGAIEGFSTFELSLVTSAYFLGFLGGSRVTPHIIRRVGHVRVFAFLGSLISAVLILYPVATIPWAWIVLRVVIGFCLSGVYITAESWLNNTTTNETRGQTLSAYMIVQMMGVVAAQGILTLGDPAGYILFIIPSVLVSLSFAPILLSIQPTPAFEATRSLGLRELFHVSPLGMVGMLLMGGVFAGQFGMAAVYATEAGLSVPQISVFIAAIFLGAMVLQYPIGWLSDRIDRRLLILGVAGLGAGFSAVGIFLGEVFWVLVGVAFLNGGLGQPLYALLIAYTNDYLPPEDMAGASAGLIFVNGIGAIAGPLAIGWMLSAFGPAGFWMFMTVIMASVALYAAWRMTRRPSVYAAEEDYEAVSYAPITPTASPVAVEAAQELYVEAAEELAAEAHEAEGGAGRGVA